MIFTRTLLLASFLLTAFSCGGYQGKFEFPRDSFIYVRQMVTIKVCAPGKPFECKDRRSGISGSGSIVKVTPTGSYVLTAEHVCRSRTLKKATSGRKVKSREFLAIDLEEKRYDLKIMATDVRSDLCLVFAEGLISRKAIPIARNAPKPGDRVHNVAAPQGVFTRDMVPLFSGYFSGSDGDNDIYSISATQGSSGSPVLNDNGEIIGVITRAFSNFNSLSLSPSFNYVSAFLSNYL